MKNRAGFVSNSSSSSFIIPLEHLNPTQIHQIKNHIEESKKMTNTQWFNGEYDGWSIDEDAVSIHGYTCMDNFDMSKFLEKIRVPEHVIEWDD